ncbi:MAG: hypothetical protein KIH04_06935, partial [Candidatus Freyarchaeota archaeon]|nr:hypothetical protein [Candidatus Jordarchaeia archaeon]
NTTPDKYTKQQKTQKYLPYAKPEQTGKPTEKGGQDTRKIQQQEKKDKIREAVIQSLLTSKASE